MCLIANEERHISFWYGQLSLRSMRTIIRIVTILLLLFNGIGALYGGWSLMVYPDGSGMKMSTDLLQHSPFTDFFIPGLVLFIMNGLLSLLVTGLVLSSYSRYAFAVLLEGMILIGWLMIQMSMLRTIVPLHFIMGFVGLSLLVCGWLLYRLERR